MDIASRIKFFMNSMAVGSSQFADSCQIPRPTLSQILNGRNKKISDEIIGKIHDAYPQLSVLWLMFGEGEMVSDVNTQISEPQTGSVIDFEREQPAVNEYLIAEFPLPDNASNVDAEKITDSNKCVRTTSETTGSNTLTQTGVTINSPTAPAPSDDGILSTNNIPLPTMNNGKRIVSIMVFYDDNSFESFMPAGSKKS